MLTKLAVAAAACLFMPIRADQGRVPVLSRDSFRQKSLTETVARIIDGDRLVPGGYIWLRVDTRMPGVVLDTQLRQRFPETITVIIEHQYRQLRLCRDVLSVALSFDGVWRGRMVIPLSAVLAHDVGVKPQLEVPPQPAPLINQAAALDQFLGELVALEPGAELAFAEILSTYIRQSAWRCWPQVSIVAMSRALKALGARRTQKRLSATDKPIFYVLPQPSPPSSAVVRRLHDLRHEGHAALRAPMRKAA